MERTDRNDVKGMTVCDVARCLLSYRSAYRVWTIAREGNAVDQEIERTRTGRAAPVENSMERTDNARGDREWLLS